VAVPEVAAVERQHAAHQRRDQGQAERDHDRLEQPRHLHVVEQPGRPQQDRRIEDQGAEAEREHRERQRHPQDHRPDDGVGDAEHHRQPERGGRAFQREPGEDRAEREQRQGVQDEEERQAAEQADGHARRV
jgi:hypothetical protein